MSGAVFSSGGNSWLGDSGPEVDRNDDERILDCWDIDDECCRCLGAWDRSATVSSSSLTSSPPSGSLVASASAPTVTSASSSAGLSSGLSSSFLSALEAAGLASFFASDFFAPVFFCFNCSTCYTQLMSEFYQRGLLVVGYPYPLLRGRELLSLCLLCRVRHPAQLGIARRHGPQKSPTKSSKE